MVLVGSATDWGVLRRLPVLVELRSAIIAANDEETAGTQGMEKIWDLEIQLEDEGMLPSFPHAHITDMYVTMGQI